MSQAIPTSKPTVTPWIISPTWDLAYLVATPIIIVPVMWIIHHYVTTPETIDLYVASFASLGHHLPGFMRCYGDSELFRRFKWRFILMPPIFLATSIFFTWNALNGLLMVIMFWGAWHGLMQLYGFMRIYDMKRGWRDAWTARLDFWLCFSIFLAGTVFSPARMYGILVAMWNSGMPLFDERWLVWIKGGTAVFVGAVTLAYIVNLVRTSRTQYGISWVKLLLAVTTGVFYWVCGMVTMNLVIGIAMFEVYHALQYYAIVWTYNRKLADRTGPKFGPLGFLFQDRWFFLGLYLTAIFLFGCFKFYGASAEDPHLQKIVIAMITASSLLHYYYDGFIWKVREKKTQVNLDIATGGTQRSDWGLGWLHIGKLALLFSILIGASLLEYKSGRRQPLEQQRQLLTMAAWMPELPELQSQLGSLELERGNVDEALRLAKEVVDRRPRWFSAHNEYAHALIAAKRFDDAKSAARRAIELNPRTWMGYYMLGLAFEEEGRYALAEEQYRAAWEERRGNARLTQSLATVLAKQEKDDEALKLFKQIAASSKAHEMLADVLMESGRFDEAVAPLKTATELDPTAATPFHKLGLTFKKLGKPGLAARLFEQAIEVDPKFKRAHFELGLLAYTYLEDDELAIEHLSQCRKLSDDFPASFVQTTDELAGIAGIMHGIGWHQEAAASYRNVLQERPDHAVTHFNLGLLLLEQGELKSARKSIIRASELGFNVPPQIWFDLKNQ